ncbi:MAG: hypothetical protein D6702_03245 [Planctomycetota bacterium]|nr:MAG: hypothetical protein D6702_03245 [Planctomycetota bacterium]
MARSGPSALLAAAVLLGAAGCGGAVGPAAGIDNLLLVTFDTTRADHLGAYGHAGAATPNLDRLAAEGVRFETCVAVAPITLPAHASILTGLLPIHHGARHNGTHALPEDVPTLAATLSAAGFDTAAVVSAVVLDSRYGLDRGFRHYDDDLSAGSTAMVGMLRETDAADTTERALRWLRRPRPGRWFLWVHYFDPHSDYAPPPEFAARCPDSPYDGEIAYADDGLGRLLDELRRSDRLDRTLVVVTADHGESLGEHGESTHGLFLYDATTRVPLILRHPALPAGRCLGGVVSQVDLVPTVLELLGLPAPGGLDGRSLVGAIRAGRVPERRYAWSESSSPFFQHGWAELRALRSATARYVEAPRPEFYDLTADPGEEHDLLPAAGDRAAPFRAALAALVASGVRDSRLAPADAGGGGLEELAGLGYVFTEDAGGGVEGERADPKDKVEEWRLIQRAFVLVGEKKWVEAEAALRELVAASPGSLIARRHLATALRALGRPREALGELRRCLALPGVNAEILLDLAVLERELGEKEWRQRVDQAAALEPRDPTPWARLGDWQAEDGDETAARASYRRALALDEAFAPAWRGLGRLDLAAGRLDRAEEELARATVADPQAFDAWLAFATVAERRHDSVAAAERLARAEQARPGTAVVPVRRGNLAFRSGDLAAAERFFRQAVERRPNHFEARFNLGTVLLERGDAAGAAEQLAAACARRPQELPALLAAAAAHQAAGRPEEAAGFLERAREVDPVATAQAVAADPLLAAIGD